MVAGEVVEVVTTIGPQKNLLGVKILHGKVNGIKFHETRLSRVNFRMEIRFCTTVGDSRI